MVAIATIFDSATTLTISTSSNITTTTATTTTIFFFYYTAASPFIYRDSAMILFQFQSRLFTYFLFVKSLVPVIDFEQAVDLVLQTLSQLSVFVIVILSWIWAAVGVCVYENIP